MRLGLIAGNGRFPFLVLEAARAQGHDVTIIAAKEETFSGLNEAAARTGSAIHWISLGQLGTCIKLTGGTQISGSWTVLSGQTVDLAPGTYWVTGNLTVQSSGTLKCSVCDNSAGTGVTIILTTQTNTIGAVSIASKARLNLNASSSGQFPGLLFVQDSNDLPPGTTYTSKHSTIGGASGATLNGLVYFPNSSMTFHGDPSAIGPKCLLIVASKVTINATSNLETGGCSSAGLTRLPTVSTVALAE